MDQKENKEVNWWLVLVTVALLAGLVGGHFFGWVTGVAIASLIVVSPFMFAFAFIFGMIVIVLWTLPAKGG